MKGEMKMIQSVQEAPLVLTTNNSDITFSNDELKTRSATCSGWLNHTEGTSQYTILGNGNCCQPAVYDITVNAKTIKSIPLKLTKEIDIHGTSGGWID